MIETTCDRADVGSGLSVFQARPSIDHGSIADMPLRGLEGSGLADRFRHWRGASERRYLFSVFPVRSNDDIDSCPRYKEAVVLAVMRKPDGARQILWACQTGCLPDLVFDGEMLQSAVAMGANEIHMHLLAQDHASRDAMIQDIVG